VTPQVRTEVIAEQEVQSRRLGRHVEHDPRSRAYSVPTGCRPTVTTAAKVVTWRRRVPILNQGQIGACTGFAMAGLIGTDAAARKGNAMVGEGLAIELYERATFLDGIPDAYPPHDTGSTGLAVAKAAVQLGFLAGYRHAFTWRQVVAALASGPAITGISWRESMDFPDPTGLVTYEGEVRGGHEIEVIGLDIPCNRVWFANSWGTGWGLAGYFAMSIRDYKQALAGSGDVTVPVWAAPINGSPLHTNRKAAPR
jgi:hypothetical protein